MYGNMVSSVALDLVLGIVGIRVVRVSPVVKIPFVHFDDRSRDVPRFRIPGDVIADLELSGHDDSYLSLRIYDIRSWERTSKKSKVATMSNSSDQDYACDYDLSIL